VRIERVTAGGVDAPGFRHEQVLRGLWERFFTEN
jgi:hypothetical protein